MASEIFAFEFVWPRPDTLLAACFSDSGDVGDHGDHENTPLPTHLVAVADLQL
jgi:hypothetical protein